MYSKGVQWQPSKSAAPNFYKKKLGNNSMY